MAKTLPFDRSTIDSLAQQHPTPFYIYDEAAMRQNVRRLLEAFCWCPRFREFFAVKATPNPAIMRILQQEGCGADCSSLAELYLSERVRLVGENVMFTSNNTPAIEYQKARKLGAIINLDHVSHLEFLKKHAGMPDLISLRYNPGSQRTGNVLIGKPEEAKFGCTRPQLLQGYEQARKLGATRFGLHTMVASNELNPQFFIETAEMLFSLARELNEELGLRLEFINLGGGMGIPYRPDEIPLDYASLSRQIKAAYDSSLASGPLHDLAIFMENGRVITGPYGYLVTQVIHKKTTYKTYIGVDASMANLMRPGMYGAYHHITVLDKEDQPPRQIVDVVGSLCENNDKFAIDRPLPSIEIGDFLVIHDVGAHGHAMGFQYNGKLRSAELLLQEDNSFQLIRRAETLDDYFATLTSYRHSAP